MTPAITSSDVPSVLENESYSTTSSSSKESNSAEETLERELAALSLNEHEMILFDLHGISQVIEEDPLTIETKLQELEEAVENIPSKDAYNLALQRNKEYVTNKDFRLLFLRSQRFNVPLAAQFLVFHFELKRNLFGDGEVLVRDIRQSDLIHPEEQEILHEGLLQVMPKRDASDRPVMIVSGNIVKSADTPIEHAARALFYLRMKVMDDIAAQKNGVIWIMYCADNPAAELLYLQNMLGDICDAIPQWIAAGHVCGTSPALRQALAVHQLSTPPNHRFRIRSHLGTHEEIAFELQTFGIMIQEGPMQLDGTWSTSYHREWLQRLKEQEDAAASLGIDDDDTIVPQRFDILLGKTKRSLDHTGNRRLLHVCEMYYTQYSLAKKFQKTEIADRIVTMIHESGGRFLTWKDGKWVIPDHLVARDKVSHTFRHLRAKQKARLEICSRTSSPSSNGTAETDDTSSDGNHSINSGQTTKRVPSSQGDDSSLENEIPDLQGKRVRNN